MNSRAFAWVIGFVAFCAVCNIRPVFASAPYEGDSTNSALDGIKGVNTASGGLGVHGVSDTSSVTGAAVRGEALFGGWGGWFSSTQGTALIASAPGGSGTGINAQGSAFGGWFKGAYGVHAESASTQYAAAEFVNTGGGDVLQGLGGSIRITGTVGGLYVPGDVSSGLGKILFNGAKITAGTGGPNGVVVGNPGDIYVNKVGGPGSTLYIKESGTGNTGWVGK